MNATLTKQKYTEHAIPVWLIPVTLVICAIVALACIVVSLQTLAIEDFGGLGDPVKVFAALVVLIPTIASIYLCAGLLLKHDVSSWLVPSFRDARYGLMFFFFIGAALSFTYLIWQSGAFNGLEYVVTGFMNNAWLGFVFAGAYVISWIAGRSESKLLSNAAFLIGAMGVIVLLVASGLFQGLEDLAGEFTKINIIMSLVTGIIFSVLASTYLMRGPAFGETPWQRTAWQGWVMLAPNILGFVIFFAGPLLLSLYLSFTNDTVGQTPEVIWFDNYAKIMSFELKTQAMEESPQKSLTFGFIVLGSIELGENRLVIGAKDPNFWISLRNTIAFCLLLLPMAIIPALLLSITLNSALPGMKIYRAIFFLPSVAAVVGTAIIWRWLYSPNIGYYHNVTASIMGWANTTFGLGINDPQISWLTDPNVVLISIVLLAAWQIVGNNTVLFLAGLQGIPRELYEAASIDGASGWRSFWSVTLPMLRPTTFFVVITVMVTGLQVFNEPYALFPSRPIPVQAQTSVFYLYQQGFFSFQFGYASAIAWFLFVIIFSLTFIQFRLQRNND